MRSAGRTTEELRIRAEFWFAVANRIYGRAIENEPYGPREVTLREKLGVAAYNRGLEWQERIRSRNVSA